MIMNMLNEEDKPQKATAEKAGCSPSAVLKHYTLMELKWEHVLGKGAEATRMTTALRGTTMSSTSQEHHETPAPAHFPWKGNTTVLMTTSEAAYLG